MAFSSVFSILLKFPLLMIIMVNEDEDKMKMRIQKVKINREVVLLVSRERGTSNERCASSGYIG